MKSVREIIKEEVEKFFKENYPTGAQYDRSAPYNQGEDKGVVGDKITPNFKTNEFDFDIDGHSYSFTFDDVMEKYFEEKPESFDLFEKMFPESNDMYIDAMKYLLGQGYDFKDYIQDIVDRKVEMGKIDLDRSSYYIDENIETNDYKYIIYKTEISGGSPIHTEKGYANDEKEAYKKVKELEGKDPEGVYYFDKKMPINKNYKLN